jgi:ABC-type branched-subunit amino acid transport system ATPase component
MPNIPIQKLTIKNCGCIKSAEVNLTRLHALIGPNDSGKSTILRALRTATQFATGEFARIKNVVVQGSGPQGWQGNQVASADLNRVTSVEILPFVPLVGEKSGDAFIGITLENALEYQVGNGDELCELAFDHSERPPLPLLSRRQPRSLDGKSPLWTSAYAIPDPARRLARLKEQIAPATLVRFDPDALRAAAPLLLDGEGVRFADERGAGLPAVYDAIRNNVEAFQSIVERVRDLFPTVKNITVSVPAAGMKAVKVTLKDGKDIGAHEMSEGLLYFLGFAALQYCGPSLLLVEEPENGLHPSRIRDVMNVLRKISESTQVVLATHSPLVINEMKPNEVTVVTRDAAGTHCMPIGKTKGFEDRIKVYALGELWLSYANGKDEAPLLNGGARE